MPQSLPWSVKGIDADTREAAREAARRAGLSVSDWLEHAIREEARRNPAEAKGAPRAEADEGALQTRLRRLAQSGSGAAMDTAMAREGAASREPARRREARGRDDLDALIEHAAQIESRTRSQEAKTTTALESIVGWIEKAETRMAAAERAAAERQERAASVIADAIKTVSVRVANVEADVERRAQPSRGFQPHASAQNPADMAARQPARRPTLSREGLANAVSDIQSRRRQLDEPAELRGGPAPAFRQMRDEPARHERMDAPLQAGNHPGFGSVEHGFIERRASERRAEVTPLMNGLRTDLAQLRSEIAALSGTPASSSLEASIRELTAKLDRKVETGFSAPIDELARPLARIEAELTRLQSLDSGNRFSRVEGEIQRLGERIEALATHHEPRILAAAVHELSALKDAFGRSDQAPRLDDLSSQISTLSRDMARIRDEIVRSRSGSEVESAIEDMRAALLQETRDATGIGHGLLTRIAHQMETVASAIDAIPASGIGEEGREQLSLLSNKLDQLAHRTQPESDLLARRIEDLAIKLDDMAGRGPSELFERVERMSQQIEDLSSRGPAAIERQIDGLATRVEALAAAQEKALRPRAPVEGATMDLTPIEDMIADLARRLEDASRPDSAPQGLHSLERQIAALADRLDTRPAGPSAPDGLESTLQDLMRSLGGLRDETASAVDKAARAAVADAMSQASAHRPDAPDLGGLRSDLAGLKDVHASIDQRTNSAIGAVNDTLEKIVHRLAQIEDDMSRERPEPAPQPASAPLASDAVRRDDPREPMRDTRHDPRDRDELAAERAPMPQPGPSLAGPDFEPGAPPAIPPRVARTLVPTLEPKVEAAPHPLRNLIQRTTGRDQAGAAPSAEPAERPLISGARQLMQSAQRVLRQGGAEPSAPAAPPKAAPERMPAQAAAFEDRLELDRPLELEAPLPARQAPQSPALPDLPLEPGSGRPRDRADASSPAHAGALNPNLIAAARRAALAASVEAEALKSDDRKPARAKSGKSGLASGLKETLEKRKKPILLGLAAIVLAIGASHVATSMLSDGPAQTAPSSAAVEPGQRVQSPPRPATDLPEAARPAEAAPSRNLPADRSSQLNAPRSDETGSVPAGRVEMAALSPANAAPEPGRFAPPAGRIDNLGDLPPNAGTPGMRKAALEGNVNAVYEIGQRAADGVGMPRDARLALRLFERAAAAGFAPAQFRLANMHEKGIGTARDAQLAMNWYRRAADKGNAKAMHNLAVLIAEGADGKADYSAAAAMFRQAAEHGVRDSQYNLAILLGRGLGAEQDLVQSYTWFAVAAREGDADAAKKRDEVGAKLTPIDLAAGRSASLSWKPKTPDPAANEAMAPAEGWDPAPKAARPAPRPRST
jgi:localization factor PodJL